MGQESHSVTRSIEGLRSEDPEERNRSAAFLWGRYGEKLQALARSRLDTRLKKRVSEEDVLQDAFGTFCRDLRIGRYREGLKARGEFEALIVRIIVNVTAGAAARNGRGKRDYRREQSVTGLSTVELLRLGDTEPSTEAVAAYGELMTELERRLQRWGFETTRILAWKLEGHTVQEIAGYLDCSSRTIERRLERIREIILELA